MLISTWLASLFKTQCLVRQRRPAAVPVRMFRPSLEFLEDRLAPALYIVNSLADTDSGSGNSGDLLYCINEANANGRASDNIILFGVSGLINLTSALPDIDDNLSLTAPANSAVIVKGNGHGSVFFIDYAQNVSMSGLTITGGDAYLSEGGGIQNAGTLTVSDCTLIGNSAVSGGGISNYLGSLTVSGSTLTGNSAGGGGGIFNDGGTLTVSDSTLSGNSATYAGGGILNYHNYDGAFVVSGSTLSGNSAGSDGGGIYNEGTLTVSDSALSGNSAPLSGGGIFNEGILAVSDSTLFDNSAQDGGGVDNEGTLTMSNSTLFGNSATPTNAGGLGGGIYNVTGATLAVSNSTLSANVAEGNGSMGGGIDQQGTATLFETIVAGNTNPDGAGDPDFSGAVSPSVAIGGATYSEGFNLIGDDAGSSGFSNGVDGDQVGTSASPVNPELGPLQNNGGPTETMALLSDSPAINAGDPDSAGLPEYDQRGPGFVRVAGGRIDIGAYESLYLVGPAALISPYNGNNQAGTVNEAYGADLEVLVTDLNGNAVSGVPVTFTAPGSGASGAFKGSGATVTETTNAEGIAAAPAFTANGTNGSVTIGASFGALSTSFSLKNSAAGRDGTFAVTSLGDSDPTDGGAGSGASGDLRYVLNQADNAGGNDSISFAPGLMGTIDLAAALPDISTNLTLIEPAAGAVIVNGYGHGSVFTIDSGETDLLSGLTVTGGDLGGIENRGTLTLSDCTLSANDGGILNYSGTLTVSDCTLSANHGDGGITNEGMLTVNDSILSANSANFAGGGIVNEGTLAVNDSTLIGNTAISGGGICNDGTLTVSDSTLSANSAKNGGGIVNDGTLAVCNSTLSANSAQSGGGIYNDGTLAVSNSTLSENSVSGSGGLGGGIDEVGGTATLFDTIAAGNSALNGAVAPDFAGAVSASVVIGGVTYIEGYNLIGDDTGSTGFSNGINGDQVGSSVSPINPELGLLQNNGGPTQTMALLGNSPAINAGDPNSSGLPEDDQRGPGFARLVGSRLDIGAYEYQTVVYGAPALLSPVSGWVQNTIAGTPFATLLQVQATDNHGNPVPDELVTFTAPTSGSSGTFNALASVLTNSQGIATAPTLAANHLLGSFDVSATVAGLAGAADFDLTITAAPVAIAVVTGSSQKATVDGEFAHPLEVLVTGANKAPIAGITVVFEVPSAGAGAAAAGPLTVVTNASGIATSPVLIADTTAGSFTVLASVAGLATQAKFTLTNTAAAAASLSVLSGTEQSATIGKAYAKPLEAVVKDSFGNPVSGATVTFSAPTSGANGLFGKKSTVTAVTDASGVATAPVLTANATAGNFSVSATIGGGASASFNLSNVATAPAKAAASGGTPQTATVNQQFGTPLQVKVANAKGTPVSGVWVTFSAPASGASGQFSGSASVQTNSSGVATAPTLTANTTAGKFSVTATVSGLAGSVVFSLTNQTGSPASIVVVTGSGQSVAPHSAVKLPLSVVVTDAFGNVISGAAVTFTVEPNAGSGAAFSGNSTATATTSATGHAVAPVLLADATAGSFTLIASVNGLADEATFTLTIL